MSQLAEALNAAKLKLLKFDPSKSRPISLSDGTTLTYEKFGKKLVEVLRERIAKFPDVFAATMNIEKMQEFINEHAEEEGVLKKPKEREPIPESYKELTLNLDESHKGRELSFFMTTPKEYVSQVSGSVYLKVCGIPEEDAVGMARKVVPEYRPRSKPGIIRKKSINGELSQVFNSYVPPDWMNYEGKTPDELPPLFRKLVFHLFPLREEREYFFSWLYHSLYSRAFTYLILCGPGAIGKNRLKAVLRALHGHQNTVDGKKTTFTERFNSQLGENTLIWFDELSYDMEMENVMKELQNDSISIEKKGVDATKSTKVWSSVIISNNKPRDNYIAFDARKFAPLRLTTRRLDTSMTKEEIAEMSRKVDDWSSKHFDNAFLAQIGRWIKKHGKSQKWDAHLEYKGPMFYKLAHTSMSKWQKRAVQLLLDAKPTGRAVFDEKKGYLWSSIADSYQRRSPDRSLQFPDNTTVKHFFDIFVDLGGKKAFKTQIVEKDIMNDFWVKLLNKDIHIITEVEAVRDIEGKSNGEKEAGKPAVKKDKTKVRPKEKKRKLDL